MTAEPRSIMLAILAITSPMLLGATGFRLDLESRLLDAHNRERYATGLDPMAWDPQLAADAREWGEHLAKTGTFEHYEEVSDADTGEGENLWMGSAYYYAPETMVSHWIEEKENYVPGVFPNVSATGDLADVGHYTQIVWRDTRKVGCALVNGGADEYLVCRYSAAGNVIGETPY